MKYINTVMEANSGFNLYEFRKKYISNKNKNLKDPVFLQFLNNLQNVLNQRQKEHQDALNERQNALNESQNALDKLYNIEDPKEFIDYLMALPQNRRFGINQNFIDSTGGKPEGKENVLKAIMEQYPREKKIAIIKAALTEGTDIHAFFAVSRGIMNTRIHAGTFRKLLHQYNELMLNSLDKNSKFVKQPRDRFFTKGEAEQSFDSNTIVIGMPLEN